MDLDGKSVPTEDAVLRLATHELPNQLRARQAARDTQPEEESMGYSK